MNEFLGKSYFFNQNEDEEIGEEAKEDEEEESEKIGEESDEDEKEEFLSPDDDNSSIGGDEF